VPEVETPQLPSLKKDSEFRIEDRVQIDLDEQTETIATNAVFERSGVSRAASASISNTHATVKQIDKSDINKTGTNLPEDNREMRETIMLDEKFSKNKFRLGQHARPLSNHSAVSTSTNRYGATA
jgi:hypothetical protein